MLAQTSTLDLATVNNSAGSGLALGVILTGDSDAGLATINNVNSSALNFLSNSTADHATITNTNATVYFGSASQGGMADIANNAPNSIVDLSDHISGAFYIGSISGPGIITFGSSGVQLHIEGGSGTSHSLVKNEAASAASFIDNINGIISGTGGITMDAAGTLTLSAANTYTGDTVITNGTVELAATGSIAGNFDFQNASGISATLKLDGTNQIGGTVNGYLTGDDIDFASHAFVTGDHLVWTENAANTGGTLALVSGTGTTVTTLNLTGSYTQSEFNLASDGNGGTMFTTTATATLNPTAIGNIYQAVLQRAPTQTEVSNWLATDASSGDAAVISQIVSLSEAQFNVYPVIQIIKLAIGLDPTAAQLAGWVPFVESNGLIQGQAQSNILMDQMATAFVASDNFGKVYNNGVDVDPNSAATAQEMQVIIQGATGIAATQAQVNAWVGLGLTIDQVFVDFALGDQYTAASQTPNQQFLASVAYQAASTQTAVLGSADVVHH